MEGISGINKAFGTLTCIPYPDNFFDVVYTCEALEHAVDIKCAIREMARVTKPHGKIVIVDKNKEMLGALEIGEWEQWFDSDELLSVINKYYSDTMVISDIPYGNKRDGLFLAWISKKN